MPDPTVDEAKAAASAAVLAYGDARERAGYTRGHDQGLLDGRKACEATHTKPPTLQPTQPALIAYNEPPSAEWAKPGALVVAGRDNYAHPNVKAVAAAGGTVLVYLDALIDNAYGRYHEALLKASQHGPAAALWPGNKRANQWGNLADFRPGSVIQTKLEPVLEQIVTENPHIGGFLADDLGSRSWYPDAPWPGFTAIEKTAYRAGAIELAKTFRRVCDRHGLMFVANGTWGAGTVAAAGGGYPRTDLHGCSLADGLVAENHDVDSYWGGAYTKGSQWAAETPRKGGPVVLAIHRTETGRKAWVAAGATHVAQQPDYTRSVTPWGAFHPAGLPAGR